MSNSLVIQEISRWLQTRFAKDCSGHDWWHLHRVRNNALVLAKSEGVQDLELVELASLLHDIADYKIVSCLAERHEILQSLEYKLLTLSVGLERTKHILQIMEGVSYKGAGVETPMNTIEGCVVQDADRLDALGAIGISRVFAYGGSRGRAIHLPESPAQHHDNFASYTNNQGTAINHFYEKLLLLKDRMLTSSGKIAASERHDFLENFLERFLREWDGKDLPH